MSLEDVIKRKLEEQKKTELVLKKLDAQKNAEQPTQNKDGAKWYEGYFQAGDALKNGYDKGDVSKTVVGTEADVFTNLVKGVVGWGESAVDAGAVALGNIAANFGNQEFATKMGEFAKKDLYDEEAVARQILKIAPVLSITNPGTFIGAHMANAAVRLDDWLSMKEEDDGSGGKITVKKDNSILGEKTGGLISSTGEMFVKQAANQTGVPIGSLITAVTAYGNQAEQALKEGATAQQAHWSAAISAGAEIIFEKMSGGIKLGGVPMDEALRKQISNSIAPVAIKNLLNLGLDVGGEAGEEFLTEFFSKLGTALYKKEDLADILFSPQALNDYINAAIGGGLMGGAFNVPSAVVGTTTGRDYKTGRNENEQTVIDKVYKDRVAEQEKGGKKLTTKEKGQILDAVEQAYERGEIAVEDIEAALGGETYRKYTEATKQQEAMQAEFDKLNGMKKSDMTGAQEDRLQELRQQLEAMKTENAAGKLQLQYQQEARAKAGGGQLMESYNQREQRRQAFQADLESYDAKQRAIVQKAIDSGILNNTRKSHEFVDLVAKIGAETGTDFDFTNSKKLRESGFALEGVTVNGFTDGKTVTVNINSAKALNTVVGHEIMHVLQDMKLDGKLQEQLFAYAKKKGEFNKRRADLETLYAGRDADIDRELAADLVGDYLFTDIDFVRNLKAGDRNLFQRVFDEIKHLVKLATAGSKEARELEKVKKLFEDVYREAGRPGVETVTDKQNAKGLDTEQEVDFSLSRDAEFSDNAIAKNNTTKAVDPKVMEAAKTVRSKIADRMMEIKEKGLVGLPEDIEGDTFLSNSSYGGSMENTTVCPRSLAAEAFMNAVSEAVGRPLTVQEQIYVSQDLMNRMGSSEELRSNMLALECVYCYVAMDRKAQREYLGKYLEQRDAVVEQLKQNPEISTAGLQKDHRALAEHFKNKKSQMPQLSEIGKLYNEYLNGRKPTKNTYKRFKMWVDAYKNGARMVSGSDLANMERLMKDIGQEFGEDLRPQIEDALDYAQKASWAKKRTNYVAYDGKILRMSLDRINKLNSHYGLRMYSFSDFHPAFVLENMQMITDASVRGLKMLGYTKELDFVKIFAPSGMNINISTFGFNSGGNVYENNIMGANWQEAQELRKQYPNVGITYIATDDAQVRWAMEQDWIDVVIPFHMVKTGAEVAEHYGFTNYTKESADQKTKDWKKGSQASIAPTQHNNDLETYLQALAENNLQPRFERFMTNEDGTPNPNYMKLVNECRQSAAESKPVQPIFNEEAAMEAMAKLEANGYYTPIGGSVDRMYEIAADVAEDLATDTGKKRQFSLSPEADRAYMDAVENANMDAAQVMVDEAAKQAGFTEEVYHGTRRGFGFTKYDPNKSNVESAFFTSGDLAVARTYSQDDGVTNISLAQELGLTAGNYRFFANTEGMIEIDAKGGVWDAIRLDQELQDKLNSGAGSNPYDRINPVTSTNELAGYAKKSGYRVVKITNVYDQSMQPGQEYHQEKPGSVYIFLYPNEQLRSADPVTYDDKGNVIPLSQRFNPQSGDFRESLSRAGETAGFDDRQIYGRDVALEAPVQKAPVAAQPENKATGMEAPTAAEMPKAQTVEAPVAEEKPVQTEQEEAKAAPAMEAPTAAEMPGEKPVEAPVAEETKEGAVETKAPKEGMEPVASPKVYRPGEGKLKPKAEDMSQEEREYRDSMEDKPVKTFRDVMEKKLRDLQREIEENRRNKQTVAEQYDEKIQSLKDEFVALKNKNTKHAQDILRSISRNQQLKEARMAEYDKRINDLTKRVQRTQERIDSDTGRADWAQGKLDKIDAKYEEELEALETRQKEQRRELEAKTASKEQYFADRALELYDELSTLKKGVKASEDLAYFLDRGHTWNAIKSALLLVKDKPSGIANPHFGLEKIVRERLEQRYNDALAELADLDTQQAMDRKALEDAMKKEKATLQASQIKKTKMEQYQAESAELAGNTATWKDKKTGFGYSMQTMHRYLREVVRDENGNPDIARADAIYAYLQGTYNQNEAALKREAKKRKDQIRKLGLNKYEDEYGAMLGELKYNPESQNDAELAYRAEEFLEAHKDKIDLEKTNKAIEMLRSEYDELIELLNNALREQGFREIPYRKGYFPHFMEPSQNFVQKLLNWKPKNNEIPTSIAGMTEEFNPQRSWQGFDKERKGNATVYSLQKGYNQYLDGALDWIYHIADIQRRRAFENHIREVHTDENARKRIEEIRDSDQYDAEEAQAQIESVLAEKKNPLNNLVVELRRGTNTLAGKKSSMDRSVEADFGRWVYSTMTNVANRSSANMVAGNLASAATNVIPIVQSWTQVKPRNSFKAVKQMIQAMNNDDGLVEKSAFLTNRLLQNESLYKDTWDKIGDVVSLPMEAVDKFTSQVVWRSKYIENIEKGMSEEAAIRDADQFAENVIAGRSRGNMPTIFDSKNPIYKVLTAFQLEVANQYGYFFKDVPTDTKAAMKGMTEKQKTEEKTKLAIGLTNMLLGTYVYNAAMESITGNTPATDPIRILEGIIRDIWGEAEDDDEEETGEEIAHVAASALEELAKELPYIGGLLGGGRISSAAAIPYGDPFNMIKGTMEDFGEGDLANLKKEWLNLVYYGILPMGGGQIKKINEGIGMYLDPSEEFPFLPKIAETPGSYTTSGNLRYAVEPTVWNVLQSILFGQYANANAREYFDEGRSPLSPNQVEEFSSVDMSMSEYWDYRDALKAAGDKTADKMEVVMGLDLPMEQKNILANNIANRKDPIDLTGAEDFGSFAEFDFYSQNPEKYKFLNDHGISWKEYTGLNAEEKDAVDKLFNAPKKTEFLLKKGITAAQWKDMDEEAREELNFEYNNPEKYSFLQKNGISVADYSGFDEATKDAWDTMAKNPKKYEFLKKQGVTVDQYKLFNQGWKDAWNWAYNNQDAYLVSQGVTKDLYTYRRYVDKINGISGDKRKSDVWKYIQGLDLSDGAKLLLFKQEYPKDDTYDTEIVRYVQSLGMTYAEKKRILEKLGF